MPVALAQFIDTYANAPSRRPAYIFAGAGVLLAAAAWSVTVQANNSTSTVAPLYPTTAPVISIVDVPNLTVLQVLHKLPITSRFDTLLSNSGVRQSLTGMGPYTVFAPADNYFDYVPRGAYAALSRTEETELAKHMVVSSAAIDSDAPGGSYVTLAQDQLPIEMQDGAVMVGSGFAIKAYRANNGVVYVVNQVLVPDDLSDKLSSGLQ